jgi:hypothetical protein
MATTLRTQWQTKQNYIWLAFGGACLFGALVLLGLCFLRKKLVRRQSFFCTIFVRI